MKHRVWGWEFFQALERNCKTENGYGAFSDVQGKGHLLDQTESFLGAETLKYLFLLFSSKVHVDLSKEFFSTEGHVLPIRSLVCSDSSLPSPLISQLKCNGEDESGNTEESRSE